MLSTGQFLAWAFFCGEALALLMALAPGIPHDRPVWFGVNSLIIQWIIFGTLALIHMTHHGLSRLSSTAQMVAILILLLIVTATTLFFFNTILPVPLIPPGAPLQNLAVAGCGMALLLGLMSIGIIENHLRLQRLALQASQAQLQALQARIRPHFLFNTLNSAVALVRSEPARAENLLIDMADLFRSALSPASTITLAEEIDLCRRYIAIEQARFGDRLQTHWQLPDPLPALAIPPLCLQPLVENAVHHGVERSHGSSLIQIHARLEQDRMVIDIGNPLHAAGARHHHGHGVGLEAVRARLAAYSEQARLETWQADGHFHARLQLPLGDQVTTR
ncbi:sensor histidine kinase [Stenotrophomonas koreensis]|uniref:sensor histidine kinase n=1 Tax=Stenotrophomonas koreensis TaxID=266128 RepID=UPI001364DEBB|nr:histidine kinase [Stenotrophomonas koreensis]